MLGGLSALINNHRAGRRGKIATVKPTIDNTVHVAALRAGDRVAKVVALGLPIKALLDERETLPVYCFPADFASSASVSASLLLTVLTDDRHAGVGRA